MKALTWGYTTGLVIEAQSSGKLQDFLDDLDVFNQALLNYQELVSVLEDPMVKSEAKILTVNDLLSGASTRFIKLCVVFAIKTERPSELRETLSEIYRKSMDHQSESWVGSGSEPMSSRQVARNRMLGFAKFYCDYAEGSTDLDLIEDQVFDFARTAEKNSQLRWALADLVIPVRNRVALLDEVLSGANEVTKKLCRYVLLAGRMRDVVSAFDEIAYEISKQRGRRIAEVRSAVSLSQEQTTKLKQYLTDLEQVPVELRVVIDPELIAGIILTVGNKMLDTSFRSKINELSQELSEAV